MCRRKSCHQHSFAPYGTLLDSALPSPARRGRTEDKSEGESKADLRAGCSCSEESLEHAEILKEKLTSDHLRVIDARDRQG